MIKVKFFKPFHLKTLEDNTIIIVFAHKFLSIEVEGELFDFIPIENRRIIINIFTNDVRNLKDIFVFKNKSKDKIIKMHVFELMHTTDIKEHIAPIIKKARAEHSQNMIKELVEIDKIVSEEEMSIQFEIAVPSIQPKTKTKRIGKAAMKVIRELECVNIDRLIDDALLNRDKALFKKLVALKKRKRVD